MTPDEALGLFDPRFQGANAQFAVLDPKHDFVSSIDAQGLTKGCRNYNSSICANTGSALAFHVPAPLQMNGNIM